jgi:membrane-bound serine protease (ClpP class)
MLRRVQLGWAIGLLAAFAPIAAASQDTPRPVYHISVEGALTPTTVSYVERGIDTATRESAELLLLTLNTPGGRLDFMQQIVEAIRASEAPVVVYVSPRGAAAASAGTLITLAGHASAMAPETTIGAASPVGGQGEDLGETLERKAKEDIRALARGLTARRGEKASQLAEAMIEEARAVSASEALEAGLIDFVASDPVDLLRRLDGFSVEVAGRQVTLATAAASIRAIDMTLIEQILSRVADPNVLALLLFIGAQAILIELSNPGGWVAGFVGVVCLALAVYGLGVLPVDWFGLALIALAFVLFVLDVKAPTHGALTAAGAVTLVVGLLVLFSQPGVEEFGRLSIPLVVSLGLGSALFFAFIVAKGLRAQRARPVTGVEGLIGSIGAARGDLAPEGFVFVQGERWRAVVEDGPVSEGAPVQVVGIDGFRLRVRRVRQG